MQGRAWGPALLLGALAASGCGSTYPAAHDGAEHARGGNAGSSAAPSAGESGGIAADAASTIAACAGASGDAATSIPTTWHWSSSDPLVAPRSDANHPLVSIKDPTVVRFDGRFHLFATTGDTQGAWNLVYLNFSDWSEAARAEQHYLGDYPPFRGYRAAPQVFFFTPQKKWYLVFQSGQPQYATTDDLTKPESWSMPRDFFAAVPRVVEENRGDAGWLDFDVICDAAYCYLFFTDDNGHFYRSRTTLAAFPSGFDEPVVVLHDDKEALYEASHTYYLADRDRYLTLIEAVGADGHRFFRAFVAATLDGEWTPLAATQAHPFAGARNVTFASGAAWSADISHGDLLRDGDDERQRVSLDCLRFLYQGVKPELYAQQYAFIPWRLGLLTRTP